MITQYKNFDFLLPSINFSTCLSNDIFCGTVTIDCFWKQPSRTWKHSLFWVLEIARGRSQWPRGVRRRSAAARLLRLWVRIPPGAWMFVSCERCVLSGTDLIDELITHPEESYRLWCVVMCDLET